MRSQKGLFLAVVFCCALAVASAATRPVVEFAAGSAVAGEIPAAMAVDSRGNTYVAGTRGQNVYVAKIDPSGQRRVYTANLGGSGASSVKGIAVDSRGNAYIAGYTTSSGFPVVGGVQRSKAGGADAFVAKLDAKGATWLYATYLGGSGDDAASSIAVDGEGNAWVTGWTTSPDFPLHKALQTARAGTTDAFVAELSPGGDALAFSSYAGGGERTVGNGIALDAAGAVYVAGEIAGRAGRGLIAGPESGQDAFVVKLAAGGAERVYSALVGGSGDDAATAIAVDAEGAAYLTGWTASYDFAVTTGAGLAGGRDAFVTKLGQHGERIYSTLLGGAADEAAQSIALDAVGNAYVAGVTNSADFAASDSGSGNGGWRSFLVKVSADGVRRLASSAVAAAAGSSGVGLAVDGSGGALVAGMRNTGRSYVSKVSTCSFRLSDALKNVVAGGEEGSVTVETDPECAWTAGASESWIEVTPSGAGHGAVSYRVAPNAGAPRGASLAIGGQTVLVLQAGSGAAPRIGGFTGPIRTNAGFLTANIPANDDGSTSAKINLGFSANFYGNVYTNVWVNNNGNITFDGSSGLSTFSPDPIPAIQNVMIAPYWADVDTRAGSSLTTYGTDTVNGRPAFGVNWVNVGYYSEHIDKLNSFQLVLIGRSDLGVGFFDIEMNYSSVQWETGDASGGSGGLGGDSSRVGFTNGSGATGTYFELPGSGIHGAFLDGGPNALIANSVNSGGVLGRYVYPVRAGSIVCATGIGSTSGGLSNAGGTLTVAVTASNQACTWNVTGLPSWITVSSPAGGNGTGSGNVVLVASANSSGQRSATIVIAGQNFTFSQGPADLVITKTHTGVFKPLDTADTFTLTVTNIGPSVTTAAVTVTDALPAVFTATAMSGTGWTCTVATKSCTRSDALAAGASYPAITLTVSVSAAASGFVTNTATVAGGGESITYNDTAYDLTNITGLGFYTLTPCRVADTRAGSGKTGNLGSPSIPGATSRTMPILSAGCNVPSTAQAYSLNITVVPPGQLIYLSIWPTGSPQPIVSTLNSFDGRVLANAAIVPAGANGSIDVFVSDTSDVIIDINGYFAPAGTGSLSFYPLTPCRAADTRAGQGKTGNFGPPTLGAGVTRTMSIPQSGCTVPTTAQAYSLNITAVPPGRLTYLTTWPAGTGQPNVSTLNSFTGEVIANAAIVPAGTPNGSISVFVSDASDVIVDINGYFAPAGSQGALLYYAATPCRVADTRPGQAPTGAFGPPSISGGTSHDFPIQQSRCQIPAAAQAYSFNMTVVPPGPLIYLTTWPTGVTQPFVSTLNAILGKVVANAAIVPAGTPLGSISVFVSNTTDVIIDVNGYFAQ